MAAINYEPFAEIAGLSKALLTAVLLQARLHLIFKGHYS